MVIYLCGCVIYIIVRAYCGYYIVVYALTSSLLVDLSLLNIWLCQNLSSVKHGGHICSVNLDLPLDHSGSATTDRLRNIKQGTRITGAINQSEFLSCYRPHRLRNILIS